MDPATLGLLITTGITLVILVVRYALKLRSIKSECCAKEMIHVEMKSVDDGQSNE